MRRQRIMWIARRFASEDGGASATEYAILLSLLVLVAVAAIRSIGTGMYAVYQSIESAIP